VRETSFNPFTGQAKLYRVGYFIVAHSVVLYVLTFTFLEMEGKTKDLNGMVANILLK